MLDIKGRNQISPAELKQALDAGEKIELVDVRNFDEFQACHMADARFITLPQLELRIGEIDTSKPVCTFCKAGVRGQKAQEILSKHGIAAVNLEGGIEAWKKAGYPVVEGVCATRLGVDQQTRMVIGSLVLIGLIFNSILWWLPWFVAIMLIISGITNTCMMAKCIAKLPWNK